MKCFALAFGAVLAVAPAVLAGSPAGTPPDLTRVMQVFGEYTMAHACPISPDRALTAMHVVMVKDEQDHTSMLPLRWSQDADVPGATVVPSRGYSRDDLVLLEVKPATTRYYARATTAPKVGERLWWVAYDWRDKRRAFAERVMDGRVARIVAGHLIMDTITFPGSSGSCVLNERGEVVALVSFGKGLDDNEEVAGFIGVWGDWPATLLAEAQP